MKRIMIAAALIEWRSAVRACVTAGHVLVDGHFRLGGAPCESLLRVSGNPKRSGAGRGEEELKFAQRTRFHVRSSTPFAIKAASHDAKP